MPGPAARAITDKHRRTYRVAREANGRCWDAGTGALEHAGDARLGDGDERRIARRLLVGETGHRVLLVQGKRNAETLGGTHERELDIGTKPDSDVGRERRVIAERLDDTPLLVRQVRKRRYERPRALAIEAGHVDREERKASLRDQCSLEAAFLAEETHLVPAVAQLLGKRQRRVDVSRRTTGGNCDLELICHFGSSLSKPRRADGPPPCEKHSRAAPGYANGLRGPSPG